MYRRKSVRGIRGTVLSSGGATINTNKQFLTGALK